MKNYEITKRWDLTNGGTRKMLWGAAAIVLTIACIGYFVFDAPESLYWQGLTVFFFLMYVTETFSNAVLYKAQRSLRVRYEMQKILLELSKSVIIQFDPEAAAMADKAVEYVMSDTDDSMCENCEKDECPDRHADKPDPEFKNSVLTRREC